MKESNLAPSMNKNNGTAGLKVTFPSNARLPIAGKGLDPYHHAWRIRSGLSKVDSRTGLPLERQVVAV